MGSTCKSKYQTDTNAMPMVTNMSTFTNTLIDTMSRRWITRTADQCQYRSLSGDHTEHTYITHGYHKPRQVCIWLNGDMTRADSHTRKRPPLSHTAHRVT